MKGSTAFAALLIAAIMPIFSYAGDKSDGTLVYLKPEMSSFWHTATNRTMTFPVEFPSSASSATLTITGAFGYSETISDITESFVNVTLPAATHPVDKPATEDVFDFVLSFNDGTVRRARLGLIAGLDDDGEGDTRCIAPVSDRKWGKVNGCVAVPIPYGMKEFEIGGVVTNTALNGAQGWFPLKLRGSTKTDMTGFVGADAYSAILSGAAPGFSLLLR